MQKKLLRRLWKLHSDESGKIDPVEWIIIVLTGALSLFGIYQIWLWVRPSVLELIERVLNLKW